MEKPVNILLVEDEVINAMLIQKQMKDIGYMISGHVTTGEKAITHARENHPDIVLMDIRLAGKIDGIEAAGIIKSESDIAVIFITSYNDRSIREKAEMLNPLGYLEKPLEIFRLKNIIDNFLSG